MYNPQAPFYLEDVTDAGLRALAHHCPGLGCTLMRKLVHFNAMRLVPSHRI